MAQGRMGSRRADAGFVVRADLRGREALDHLGRREDPAVSVVRVHHRAEFLERDLLRPALCDRELPDLVGFQPRELRLLGRYQ